MSIGLEGNGGVVAVYVKDTIDCCVNREIKSDGNVKSVWLKITISKKKIVIYRPPNTTENVLSALFQEINKACRQGNICIMVDFNCDNIDWEYLVGNTEAKHFIEIVQDIFQK